MDFELFPVAWGLTEDGELQQHVIPPGESRMHFAFLPCWCGADDADSHFVEHIPHGKHHP